MFVLTKKLYYAPVETSGNRSLLHPVVLDSQQQGHIHVCRPKVYSARKTIDNYEPHIATGVFRSPWYFTLNISSLVSRVVRVIVTASFVDKITSQKAKEVPAIIAYGGVLIFWWCSLGLGFSIYIWLNFWFFPPA